jgi:flavin-dependent dehydrogenase
MNKRSAIRNPQSAITIVGGGPAGSSLAIRLANAGFCVTLFERERFPRHKLCGEFISPECLRHFRELGVLGDLLDAGGRRISETQFYAMNGRNAAVPSGWLGNGELALSLSRAEMDMRLLERARACCVDVREDTSVTGVEKDGARIVGLNVRDASGAVAQADADIFIDATGRTALLSKLSARTGNEHKTKNLKASIIGFKTHVRDADIPADRCEIYSFPGGYGGLSPIENGLANHCFMVKADRVRELDGCADRIVSELVFQNNRARQTLGLAEPVTRWLSVAVTGFGGQATSIAENVFSVGDAAAFIDPFTGSGMLMAMESSEILAECIVESNGELANITAVYKLRHARAFGRRLAFCRLLRHAAFRPAIGTIAVSALSVSSAFRRVIARSTRAAEQLDRG